MKRNLTSIYRILTHTIYYGFFILSILLFIMLVNNTIKLKRVSDSLVLVTADYRQAEEDAFLFNTASDYLTNQAHYFVAGHNIKNLRNYFNEVNHTKRREGTLRRANENKNIEYSNLIEQMMSISKELEQTEIYAFKLTCTALGYKDNDTPSEILQVTLTREDEQLSRHDKLVKAQVLVFGTDYQLKKLRMKSNLKHFYDLILEVLSTKTQTSLSEIRQRSLAQAIHIVLLFFSVTFFFVLTKILQTRQHILIRENRTDPLTGVFNRKAYNKRIAKLSKQETPVFFAMIDLDYFKLINDKYGHESGDLVLKRVASVIKSHFREQDALYRVGGDEFILIIEDSAKENGNIIISKFDEINKILKVPADNCPKCSLSCGISWSENGYTDQIVKQADIALYQAKDDGRGCAKLFI